MAGTAAKKIAARNKTAVENLRISHTLITMVYSLFRFVFRFGAQLDTYDMVWIALINLVNMVLHVHLEHLASTGTDLHEEGTALTYYFDVLYVGWVVLLGSLYSTKFYWLYAVIPIFAGYKFVSFILKMVGFFKGGAPSNATTQKATSKSKAKRK